MKVELNIKELTIIKEKWESCPNCWCRHGGSGCDGGHFPTISYKYYVRDKILNEVFEDQLKELFEKSDSLGTITYRFICDDREIRTVRL